MFINNSDESFQNPLASFTSWKRRRFGKPQRTKLQVVFFFKCSCFRHCLSLNCSESFFFIWSAYKFVRYELQTNGEDLGAGTLD